MSKIAYEYTTAVFELSKNGRLPEAYELVKEALSIYPTNPYLLNSEIYVLYRMGKIKEARQGAEEQFQVLKGNPSFIRTYLSILDKCAAYDDIRNLVDSGLFNQDFHGKAKPEFFIYAAKQVAHAGFPDKALDVLQHAPQSDLRDKAADEISKHKDRPSHATKNRYADQFKGMKSADVIKRIENMRILSQYKGDFPLHHLLAEKYKKTKQMEKATEIYKYLLTIRDDDFTRNRLGHTYKAMGLFDEAVIYLKEGLMTNPDRTHLYTALADIYTERKDPDGFERHVQDIIAVHPDAGYLYGLLRRIKKSCSE